MMDPLSDVLHVLGATVSRRTRFEAAAPWALAFPARERLKFVAVVRGAMWLSVPGRPAWRMQAGDVCLLGQTAYAVSSDPSLPAVDGDPFFAEADSLTLGGDDLVSLGGSVTFTSANADFLVRMLPDMLFVPGGSPASAAVAGVLALIDAEMQDGRMGSGVVAARLADVLLVAAIRAYVDQVGEAETGWLGALSDPRLGRALQAVHADIARPWSVDQLARLAGMSRATFSLRFTRAVGQPPLGYLRAWRLTLARTALARGEGDVASIARAVGYTSQSAFGHAFRRAFGTSPRADGAL